MIIKKYKINDYITLRLKTNKKTVIYVKRRRFMHCSFLLLNIKANRIKDYDGIRSIDEAAQKLDRGLEKEKRRISCKTEFWGHCSNLQAWAENDYDTRLLHKNLAFPLLKRLCDVGDVRARRAFKEEIAKRYADTCENLENTRNFNVILFLTEEHYLDYLTQEEYISLLQDTNFSLSKHLARRALRYHNIGILHSIFELCSFKYGLIFFSSILKYIPQEFIHRLKEHFSSKLNELNLKLLKILERILKYIPQEFIHRLKEHFSSKLKELNLILLKILEKRDTIRSIHDNAIDYHSLILFETDDIDSLEYIYDHLDEPSLASKIPNL